MTECAGLYARVSTENQDLTNQIEKLRDWAEKNDYDYDLYSEKVSSVSERPEFEKLMDNLEEYDVIAVTKLDRFGRSVLDILQQINRIQDEGVDFVTIDQSIDTSDELIGDIMMKFLAVFSEFERKMIRRRMKEGYDKAYKQGRVGRPRKLNKEEEEFVRKKYNEGLSITTIMHVVESKFDKDVSRSTIHRTVKDNEEENHG